MGVDGGERDDGTAIVQVGRQVGKASAYLFAGRIVSSLVGFLGVAIVARLLVEEYGSPAPYGWILLITFVPALIKLMGDFGVDAGALNKVVVLRRDGKHDEAGQFFATWALFSLGLNLSYSLLALGLGKFIVLQIYDKPEVYFLVPLAALNVLTSDMFNIGWNGCLATGRYGANALMLIAQNAAIAVLSPILLLTGAGVWGVATVYLVLAPVVAAAVGLSSVLKSIKLKRPAMRAFKETFLFGVPLSAGGLLAAVATNVSNTLISRFANANLLGDYSVALRPKAIVDTITYPTSTLSFPTFSRLDGMVDVASAYHTMVKLTLVFAAPVTLLLASLSNWIVPALFGPGYPEAWVFLSLLSINWLVGALGVSIAINVLSGQGHTDMVMKASGAASAAAITVSLVLIPTFGVIGAIVVVMVDSLVATDISQRYIRRTTGSPYPIREVLLIVGVSMVISLLALAVALPLLPYMPHFMAIIVAGLIALLVYLFAIKRLRIVNQSELRLLEDSFSTIPYVGMLLVVGLSLYERL